MTAQPKYVGKYRSVTHAEMIFFPLVTLVSAGFGGIVWFLIYKNRKSADINVFSDCVEINNTFIRKRINRIEASKIESVDFNEGLIGKSSYGTVSIRGTGIRVIALTPVSQPEELASEIRKIASAPISKSSETSQHELVTSLEHLQRLHLEGVLSDEEFEKAKSKLL